MTTYTLLTRVWDADEDRVILENLEIEHGKKLHILVTLERDAAFLTASEMANRYHEDYNMMVKHYKWNNDTGKLEWDEGSAIKNGLTFPFEVVTAES